MFSDTSEIEASKLLYSDFISKVFRLIRFIIRVLYSKPYIILQPLTQTSQVERNGFLVSCLVMDTVEMKRHTKAECFTATTVKFIVLDINSHL